MHAGSCPAHSTPCLLPSREVVPGPTVLGRVWGINVFPMNTPWHPRCLQGCEDFQHFTDAKSLVGGEKSRGRGSPGRFWELAKSGGAAGVRTRSSPAHTFTGRLPSWRHWSGLGGLRGEEGGRGPFPGGACVVRGRHTRTRRAVGFSGGGGSALLLPQPLPPPQLQQHGPPPALQVHTLPPAQVALGLVAPRRSAPPSRNFGPFPVPPTSSANLLGPSLSLSSSYSSASFPLNCGKIRTTSHWSFNYF